jgi:cellulose synthase/poly-beta-1,6-N-acetylglucosamine synthase-like glycosyltransferase
MTLIVTNHTQETLQALIRQRERWNLITGFILGSAAGIMGTVAVLL